MVTAHARRRRAIEHLVASDHARDLVARATFEIVADGLDLGPIAVRSAADRAWVREAIAGPIQRAAEGAIERLIEELEMAFDGGPVDLVNRILAAAPADDRFDVVAASAVPGMTWTVRGPSRLADPETPADPATEAAPLVAVFR